VALKPVSILYKYLSISFPSDQSHSDLAFVTLRRLVIVDYGKIFSIMEAIVILE
jgi:hypothetical protein